MLCESISSSELLEAETGGAEAEDLSSAGGEVAELVPSEYDAEAEDVSAASVPTVRRS